jgi:predicted helicase
MSIQLINQYYSRVDRIVQYGGSNKETAIRNEFYNLVNLYCEKKNLMLISELDLKLKNGKTITPDGTVKNALRLNFGYWESKANVDLEYEISEKIKKGYPLSNIIFEDSRRIILYQDGEQQHIANMRNPEDLDRILNHFLAFEPREVTEFNKAIEHFKQDIPQIVKGLREMIEQAPHIASANRPKRESFLKARNSFLDICKESINLNIAVEDVNEMLIQHILTEEIFLAIFSDAQFLRENNIARELYKVEETFFTGKTKYQTLQSIKHYYEAIKAAAAPIANHHEKQTFLKVVYENFYKAYNPKGADRLGIVYTPSELIKFMIEGTDHLLEKHFGKTLASKNVEILDPATGTGTYICDLIEYLPKQNLQHKFLHELHANEIAILPYYIANLNIEYTYRQKMGEYEQFPNICFVDTLDNLGFGFTGKQTDLFGSLSQENAERIKRQNEKKISVIIGNPPYNANQLNENDNNKNRGYFNDAKKQIGGVDGRIRETYIKESTAQKTKVYDMYARFYRWASDRINSETGGILSFVTNRSFVDSRTFDGFRKSVAQEFDYIYIVDTRSDVRANPKISGTGHNVFGIQTGVAIAFFVKLPKKNN